MGMLNLSVIRTEPGRGEDHPFSPPAGFKGSADDYLFFMRERFKAEFHPHGQRMLVAARDAKVRALAYTGPYAGQTRQIIEAMKARQGQRTAA